MIKKIWLPTAFTGIQTVEAYICDLLRENPKLPTIELDYPNEGVRSLREFMTKKKDYAAMISLLSFDMNKEVLNELSHLEAISNYAVGHNNVDIDAAKSLNIPFGNTPEVLNETTADTALTLLLMGARRIPYVMNDVKKGNWKSFELTHYNGVDPRGLRMGIIGFGRIGETFARKCYQLWQTPIYIIKRKSLENKQFDFPVHIVSEEEFYKEVNVLSLHCPLTDQTKKMINKEFIKKFKHPFIFINTARGAIHDENDLLWGLQENKILSVGLDVTDPEPMHADHPLLKDDRVTVLPHIGSATQRTRSEMTFMALKNVIEVLCGNEMPHQVYR